MTPHFHFNCVSLTTIERENFIIVVDHLDLLFKTLVYYESIVFFVMHNTGLFFFFCTRFSSIGYSLPNSRLYLGSPQYYCNF